MSRIRPALVLALIGIGGLAFSAQAPPPQAGYRFTEIVPGIYSAIGTGTMNVGSNSAVIVNHDEAIIVDSHISPESGRAMLQELKAITDKPVRILINTHFHYDHTNGNQALPSGVDIIGHEFTRRKLTGDILEKGMFADLLKGIPKQLDDLEARAAREADAAAKTRLDEQVRVQTAFASSLKDLKVTPPNVTLDDRMTLFRGDREIRLLYLGHGHTGGDIVVYLPKERVLCSGDLLVNGVANLIDGYVNEWPDALEKLKAIDFVDVIPATANHSRARSAWTGFRPTCATCGRRGARSTIRRYPPPTRKAYRYDRPQGALPGDQRARRQFTSRFPNVRGDGRSG